jgi:hypothetical protein
VTAPEKIGNPKVLNGQRNAMQSSLPIRPRARPTTSACAYDPRDGANPKTLGATKTVHVIDPDNRALPQSEVRGASKITLIWLGV